MPGALGIAHAHTQVKSGFNLFSVNQDAEIGRQSATQVDQQLPVLTEPASTRLVQRLGARLAAEAPGPRFTYRFKVLDLADLNAFALPGGYIYVHRGLIERVRTEGELAGVMAHEIAHVALRHPTTQVTKAYVARAGVGLLEQLLGGGRSRAGNVIEAVGGFGLNTLFLKFSRSAEAEADAVGARIMARAGYDPIEMARFFQLMRQQANSDPGRVATFFSDHPAPADREAHIRREAGMYEVPRVAPVGGLREAQFELRGLPPAPTVRSLAMGASAPASFTTGP
jgi:predicted Zn-dependent protease